MGVAFRNRTLDITQIFADSREASTYSFLQGRRIDFAFIDGNHGLESVIRDTANVLKHANPTAIIFWHDFREKEFDIDNGVKIALMYLKVKERLNIFYIRNSLLAFTMLHQSNSLKKDKS